MFGKQHPGWFSGSIFFVVWALLSGCQSAEAPQRQAYQTLEGKTMGTYYRITFGGQDPGGLQGSLDSLFVALNNEVSTYIPDALISQFNQSDSGMPLPESALHFRKNFLLAAEVFRETAGAFDPTVMPLVNYWGFGYTEKKPVTAVDSAKIRVIMDWVGFDAVLQYEVSPFDIQKVAPEVQLDFSACAKGYGVDLAGQLLESRGVNDYFIDIGGEVLAKGLSSRGDAWNVGIQTPREDAGVGEVQAVVPLENLAVATSGNYRNYYEVEGRKYSHTINPFTGFPERSTLLSVSVFHASCAVADAYATAFMVMGQEKAYQMALIREDLEAYFIVANPDGSLGEIYTPGLKAYFSPE